MEKTVLVRDLWRNALVQRNSRREKELSFELAALIEEHGFWPAGLTGTELVKLRKRHGLDTSCYRSKP